MPGRTLWISLLVAILCFGAVAAQVNAPPGKKKQPAAESQPGKKTKKETLPDAPAPAAQAGGSEKELKELKAKVEALEKSVKGLEEPQRLDLLKRLDSDVQRLARGLSRASWIVLVIVVFIVASAVWLWSAAKKHAETVTAVANLQAQITHDVNDARDQVLTRVTDTGTALQGRIDNTLQTVTNARTDITDARTALLGRVGDVLTAVSEARGVAHQDAMDVRQGLTEIKGAAQKT